MILYCVNAKVNWFFCNFLMYTSSNGICVVRVQCMQQYV